MIRISVTAAALLTLAGPVRAEDFRVLSNADGAATRRMMHSYLLASAAGVWSGTSEMSKNTVAGFGLGLPRG